MSARPATARFFTALCDFAIRRPARVAVLAAVVVFAAAPGLLRLELRTDGHALVQRDAPEVLYDRAVRDEFGIADALVVLIRSRHPDGIFNPGTVQLVRALTAEFQRLDGLRREDVSSLATEPNFRHRPGTIDFQNVFEPPLKTKAELDQLRDDLRRLQLYTGTLVSSDGNATVILLGAPTGRDRTQLFRHVRRVIAAQGPVPEEISVIGAPAAETLLGLHILDDLGVPNAWLGVGDRAAGDARASRLPRSWYELRLLIARRVGLVPLAVFCMAMVFLACFRRLVPALLPLLEVGACLIAVFGLMGWLGVPIYLTTAVMPVILTAMGVADEIYIFNRYVELVRARPGAARADLVRTAMDELWRPIVNMSATTAIGFLSFALSGVAPVRAFGLFTAVGILFCMAWSLTVNPALLTLLDPSRLLPRRAPATAVPRTHAAAALARFTAAIVRGRYVVLAGVALLVALSPLGIRRVVVQDSWIDGFAPESEFFRETRSVNERFHGTHLLLVTVDAGHFAWQGDVPAADMEDHRYFFPTNLVADPAKLVGCWITFRAPPATNAPPAGRLPASVSWRAWIESAAITNGRLVVTTPISEGAARFLLQPPPGGTLRGEIVSQPHLTPALLRRVAELGAFIEQRRDCKVGGVLGAVDFLQTTRFMMRPNDPDARRLPESPAQMSILWNNYRVVRGEHRFREAVSTNFSRSLLTVFLKDANFVDTARLMESLRAYERERLAPAGVRLDFAGDVAVSQGLIASIVTTQVQSLATSLLGILAMTAWLFRSVRLGVYCTLPSALAVLVNFAVMGWAGMPLGIATSMFAGMTLGMGVDFAIHLLERFQLARVEGRVGDDALTHAVGGIGPSVLINALAVGLGFGLLTLSQVPANARLGALVVLGVVNCLIASLLLLPVLFRVWPPPDPARVAGHDGSNSR